MDFKLIDTHAHLDFDDFQNMEDHDHFISSLSEEMNIEYIINPGVRPEDFSKVLNLVEKYSFIRAGLGVHPTEVDAWNDKVLDLMKEHIGNNKVSAIGETGLDYYRNTNHKDLQKEVLKKHIELAKEKNLPLIIHNRDAHDDILQVIQESGASKVGGVFHCFNGPVEFAEKCIEENFYIGIGGVITFKNAKDLQNTVTHIPLEYIVLETDSPFLAPHPNRGKVNSPAYLHLIAEKVAELKHISVEEVATTTTTNAKKLFRLNDICLP